MTTDGFLIGPGQQPKVPGVRPTLWRPPAPPPGQTAECRPSAGDPEKHRETDVALFKRSVGKCKVQAKMLEKSPNQNQISLLFECTSVFSNQ